jgi:hypothetical protein
VSTARKYRFNTYLFPTVDCVITVYTKNGRPARYVELLGCLEEEHGIRGKRSLDSGLDAGVEDGYIRVVPVGGRRGYVPTPLGVIDNALVNHHLDVIMDFYVNYGREALPELLTALKNYMLIDLIQRVSITMLRMFTIKNIFKLGEHDREELRSLLPLMSMHLRLKQDDLFGAWLTLKALAGLMREQDLGPRECREMNNFLKIYTLYIVNGFIGPYMVSLSIRNERFRSWASAITYLNYLFLHSAFRNKGTE